MTNWTALLRQNPEPTLLDAIEFAEPQVEYRVRIIHDHNSEDPRTAFDQMCEIVSMERHWYGEQARFIASLIRDTDAWQVLETLVAANNPDWSDDVDMPDIVNNDALRERWLDTVKDCLLVEPFSTDSFHYVAYTTPELCEKLGVEWANAAAAMGGEIELFKQWAEGDCYGFRLEKRNVCPTCEHEEWEEVDSCWGFYGSDPFENGMSDYIDAQHHHLLRNAEPEY